MRKICIAVVAILSASLIYLTYLGYFGGTLFVPIAAQSAPDNQRAGIAAVVLSGDMGFNIGMSPRIAKRLAADGIPVIGVNSLVYFRTKRTPAEVEALISQSIRHSLAFGHAKRIVLIGQSFGADMIPVGLSRLPTDLRQRIVMVGMVVPTDTLFFQASPAELFNWRAADADALPSARMLNWLPVTCISGTEEAESLCPHMKMPNVRHIVLPGGHRLHGDADSIHRALLMSIDRSITKVHASVANDGAD